MHDLYSCYWIESQLIVHCTNVHKQGWYAISTLCVITQYYSNMPAPPPPPLLPPCVQWISYYSVYVCAMKNSATWAQFSFSDAQQEAKIWLKKTSNVGFHKVFSMIANVQRNKNNLQPQVNLLLVVCSQGLLVLPYIQLQVICTITVQIVIHSLVLSAIP